MLILWIAIFGALGTVARYGVNISLPLSTQFPWATLSVNLLGSFLMGVVGGWVPHAGASPAWAVVAATGFLGGFTTFSAFSLETVRLLSSNKMAPALIYAIATPTLCVGLAALGVVLSQVLQRANG